MVREDGKSNSTKRYRRIQDHPSKKILKQQLDR
jgi:hypothetical protein